MVGTSRMVVDQLRAEGKKVGLIKVRSLRPFPTEYFASIKNKYKAIGVMERDISFGYEGAVFTEIKGAMYGTSTTPMINFVVGLGGKDISKENISTAYEKLFNIASGKVEKKIQFLGARW
ncbi:Pyruvate synthase subunit PorA [bioreactor metagenome]|uniref:Pyruvate synthase subunit PorA n=1 Tax=bioreactor metagenome TaxID=1076179 RepID=A0A645E1V7_9ZZZZ